MIFRSEDIVRDTRTIIKNFLNLFKQMFIQIFLFNFVHKNFDERIPVIKDVPVPKSLVNLPTNKILFSLSQEQCSAITINSKFQFAYY